MTPQTEVALPQSQATTLQREAPVPGAQAEPANPANAASIAGAPPVVDHGDSRGDTDSPEVKSPPAAEQITTPEPAAHTPEEIQEMRRNEAVRVVHATVARTGFEAKQSFEAKKSKKSLTEAQQAAYGYYVLSNDVMNAPIGRFAKPISLNNSGNTLHVEFSDGEFIAAGADGQVIDSIVEKIDINGETYLKCMVVGNEQDIKASELLNAQLLSEEALLLEAFSVGTDQKTVAEAYFVHLKQRDQDLQVNALSLHEAGIRTGLFEADGLRALVRRSTEDGSDLQSNLMGMLADQIIADPETAGTILHTLNLAPERIEGLDREIQSTESRIAEIKEKIKSITDTTEGAQAVKRQHEVEIAQLQSVLGEQKKQKDLLQALQTAMAEQGIEGDTGMIQLVAKLYEGNMSVDQAQQVNKALQEGNIDELLQSLLNDLPDDHPEKSKFQRMAEQATKVGIPVLGIILALLIIQGAGGAGGARG